MSYVLLDDQESGRQMLFEDPKYLITAHSREELDAAFVAIESAQAEGYWLAGWTAYELGHALETHFDAPDAAPLIHLGVFDAPKTNVPVETLYTRDVPRLEFLPDWSEDDYLIRFEKLQQYLRSGDCYQINLTFPMQAQSDATPAQIYAAFRQRQTGRYGAVVDLSDTQIVSFSPELFFEKTGDHMRMRPMKGTRPRGQMGGADDAAILAQMQAEPKSRAENLMIVDLLRNDLSRLCAAGTVKVPELFALETYPTLHQMTSQVTGSLREDVSWREIFSGLFPCGSVTGAPKIRVMEIIQELEGGPRGAYCGGIGYIAPNGNAAFSVAIRTVQLKDGSLRYDVGSGVVLDSDGPDEYHECLLKSKIFETAPEGIIETMRRLPDGSISNESYHKDRAETQIDKSIVDEAFDKTRAVQPGEDLRVRVVFAKDGQTDITTAPYIPLDTPFKLCLSKYPLMPDLQITAFKTTQRDFYDGERERIKALTGADEVIFLNEGGEICEGSFTSICVEIDGQLYTPPLSAGLLPGVWRAAEIDTGKVEERALTLDDLKTADRVFVANSLRGRMPATFIDYLPH